MTGQSQLQGQAQKCKVDISMEVMGAERDVSAVHSKLTAKFQSLSPDIEELLSMQPLNKAEVAAFRILHDEKPLSWAHVRLSFTDNGIVLLRGKLAEVNDKRDTVLGWVKEIQSMVQIRVCTEDKDVTPLVLELNYIEGVICVNDPYASLVIVMAKTELLLAKAKVIMKQHNLQIKELPAKPKHVKGEDGDRLQDKLAPNDDGGTGKPRGKSSKNVQVFQFNQMLIRVYKADITNLNVDTIVNAANASLKHEGGVAKAIVDGGGKAIVKESEDIIKTHGNHNQSFQI